MSSFAEDTGRDLLIVAGERREVNPSDEAQNLLNGTISFLLKFATSKDILFK